MAAKKDEQEPLKKIPGFSQGVRENSAVRMIKMGRPVCPNSKIEMKKDTDGRLVPVEKGPEQQNCQLQGGRWWIDCEARGHNPYFRTHKWYTEEDRIEPDENGRLVKTGVYLIPHEQTTPNVAQVAVSVRINSGQGAIYAMSVKGFKRLKDLGYEEVCQFRNCQKPVSKKYTSRKYGAYCSLIHLQLIAADVKTILLNQPAQYLNGPEYEKVLQEREDKLTRAAMGAVE